MLPSTISARPAINQNQSEENEAHPISFTNVPAVISMPTRMNNSYRATKSTLIRKNTKPDLNILLF